MHTVFMLDEIKLPRDICCFVIRLHKMYLNIYLITGVFVVKMNNLTVGVFAHLFDFTETALCLREALNRKFMKQCRNISDMWPSAYGSLIFFQVG
jgi:hypothetical protein